MDFDIGPLLENWDYQPGQITVRKFMGKDGKEKLQLRVDLGILQMNIEGRPDGKRPMGYASVFEQFQARLYQHLAKHQEEGFALEAEDCARLHFETMQYHQRAFCLLQIEDFANVIRDAERNQAVLDFVRKYAPPEFLSPFLQFLPQQILVLTRARAGLCLASLDYSEGIRHIEEGIREIKTSFDDPDRTEPSEHCGELLWLEAWLNEVSAQRPLTKREQLERDLRQAVSVEDYERAAKVRDELRRLEK